MTNLEKYAAKKGVFIKKILKEKGLIIRIRS